MDTHTLTKISAITGMISSGIVVGVLVFAISMIFMSGGGPFNDRPEIKEGSEEEVKVFSDIQELNSVMTFKETNQTFRENHQNNGHEIQYYVQARNSDTGNVYSLNVQYRTWDQQFNESTSCQLIDTGINDNRIQDSLRRQGNQVDLFIDSTIRDSNCLDDDFYEKYPHLIRDDVS